MDGASERDLIVSLLLLILYLNRKEGEREIINMVLYPPLFFYVFRVHDE